MNSDNDTTLGRTTSASHPPWISEQVERQLLRENRTVTVARGVSVTLGSESVLVLDERSSSESKPKSKSKSKKKSRGCCGCTSNEESKTKETHAIALYNIIDAEVSSKGLVITFARHASKVDVSVDSIDYPVFEEEKEAVEGWVRRLIRLAYGDADRNKKLKILINPFGGKGSAKNMYRKSAAPVFAAAHCQVDVQETTHGGHAMEIAQKIDIDAYDAIVCCSGDGLLYEVFNGLGKRPDAKYALTKMAVAMIPCGSGNALAWNLYGTGSVSVSALAIVKGIRTPMDLVSITQGNNRTLSFLSQAYGIVAECDLGTENIRWMGAHRFTYGFLVRILRKTVWPCDLAVKVEIGNKNEIMRHYAAHTVMPPARREQLQQTEPEQRTEGLPPLKYGTVMDKLPEDWEVIPAETLGNFYAGNMAIMSKDANFFPASLPYDGLLDVVTVDGTISTSTALKMMDEVGKGGFFSMPQVDVRKASAYRLVPRQKEGFIDIDGEGIPFEGFQAEVHQGLGTVLSKSGFIYEADGPR